MSERDASMRELRGLLSQMCDGDLDAHGYGRIDELVRGSSEGRQLYIDYMLLDGELRWAGNGTSVPAQSVFKSEIAKTVRPNGSLAGSHDSAVDWAAIPASNGRHRPRVQRISRRWALVGATVAAGLLVMAGTVLYRAGGNRSSDGVATTAAIAEFRSGDRCVWVGRDRRIVEGTKFLPGKQLELKKGVARFLFAKGAAVLVESPAKFELISASSLRLEYGNVAVRANGPVKDFVVVSPDASIVDLGTSFAVHCEKNSATQVEVVEGSVEVFTDREPKKGHVLEMGANVNVGGDGKGVALVATRPEEYRFSSLIEQLWSDIRAAAPANAALASGNTVEANFSDPAGPNAVDTFYEAKRGSGWLTPWVAAGNPSGKILRDDSGFGLGNPCLRMQFERSHERAIAREYGPRQGFDPTQPHVISWRWRLEGNPEYFGDNFRDRATFYGNPYFRRNSWPTNSWLIGVAGGDETADSKMQSSTAWLKRKHGEGPSGDTATGIPRRVFPKRWYFFDNKRPGLDGAVFDRRNMVDTGMALKFGVVYQFAVAVYPQEARYDAAIRDDQQTVVRTGLSFRNPERIPANVLHFAINVDQPNEDLAFSLDSIRIRQLKGSTVQQQLESEAVDHEEKVK